MEPEEYRQMLLSLTQESNAALAELATKDSENRIDNDTRRIILEALRGVQASATIAQAVGYLPVLRIMTAAFLTASAMMIMSSDDDYVRGVMEKDMNADQLRAAVQAVTDAARE